MTDPTEGRTILAAGRDFGHGRLGTISAWARFAGQRLAARRGLLIVAAGVFLAFIMFADLSVAFAVSGLAVLVLAAAALPRRGLTQRAERSEAGEVAAIPTRALLHEFLEALPDPAILLDSGGGIVQFNRKAGDQYAGLGSASRVSSILRHPELLDAIAAARSATAPVTVTFVERVPIERWTAATLAVLKTNLGEDPDGPAMLLCLHDLTEQERINQMRADFIANASHELRTPLASLLGFIETLQGPAKDDAEARERFLDIMARQAERMSRLIDDLLSLSRVEMNAHLLPTSQVELGETARYVVDTLDPLAGESRITLELDVAEEPAIVRGDRDELVQVFQNLIQNAIKYGREGGRVRVRLERQARQGGEGKRIAVSVTDDGPGIAPEHLPRLTERFYRVDVASSREKGGTGLGLAIAKHIINRHRGELKIASEPNKGSTFTVLLDESR
ncbi:MAG: ATP-binding protein [Methyloligellaceae bacterium]